ncbi:hypothetical protein V4F39_06315 [Aquincola sp. MAHUQ-54]|uniref:Copper(I)-binding protein n=1 Tax=Aquincola agrisoli TaxID=3119538 RepID=A0AAW9Q7T0_9BURK
MRPFARRLAFAAALAAALPAAAHGDLFPLRGGLVAWSNELSVELVRQAEGGVLVFVDDHGTPVPLQGATGALDITRGDRTATLALAALPSNGMAAPDVALQPGDKLQVIVNLPDGQVVLARLVVPFS